jgi:hypothetical protein
MSLWVLKIEKPAKCSMITSNFKISSI